MSRRVDEQWHARNSSVAEAETTITINSPLIRSFMRPTPVGRGAGGRSPNWQWAMLSWRPAALASLSALIVSIRSIQDANRQQLLVSIS